MSRQRQQPMITASEVGEFVYCAKAWYLKRQGAISQSPHLEPGKAFHKRHGAGVSLASRLHRVGRTCAWIALLLLIVLALIWNFEIAFK